MTRLPEQFLQDMASLLGNELPQFLESFDDPKTAGLRVNTLKCSLPKFQELSPFALTPIPWCPEGFIYDEATDRPGRHPWHEAGVYYIQEPSAMAAVPLLDVQPGDWALDLCGAPGSKSTQIGQRLQGQGILIANEISATRLKALGENIERLGVSNAVITNMPGQQLAALLPNCFSKILLDAPCSGQGMFRKNPYAIVDWSKEKEKECADIQGELLDAAYSLLAPGGDLVYSTCTFARCENEEQIEKFIEKYANLQLLHMERFWPHRSLGEGHFVAKLRKQSAENKNSPKSAHNPFPLGEKAGSDLVALWDFLETKVEDSKIKEKIRNHVRLHGEHVFYFPEALPSLKGLKVLRIGVQIGTMKKDRFEPGHGLSHLLSSDQVREYIDFPPDSLEVVQYLSGNTVQTGKNRGWILLTCGGFPLGWGKEVQGVLKNHYPKGLRKNLQQM